MTIWPTLIARGKRLYSRDEDGEEVLLAKLPSVALARLFAAAPQLASALEEVGELVELGHREAIDSSAQMREASRAVSLREHALRVLEGDELIQCHWVGCALSSADGAQFCSEHVHEADGGSYPELDCIVRGCTAPRSTEWDRRGFCQEHIEEFIDETRGKKIIQWLANREQPEETCLEDEVPAAIPGLGNEITRSGLPAWINPQPVEEALIAGEPRCIAGNCTRPRALGRIWCEGHAGEVDEAGE